jgi:hypothetical protein
MVEMKAGLDEEEVGKGKRKVKRKIPARLAGFLLKCSRGIWRSSWTTARRIKMATEERPSRLAYRLTTYATLQVQYTQQLRT